MAMAEHSAAICRVHLNHLRDSCQAEGGPGVKIPNNRLQVGVTHAAARNKCGKACRQFGGIAVKPCIIFDSQGHKDSAIEKVGVCCECKLGRLEGIEPSTSCATDRRSATEL